MIIGITGKQGSGKTTVAKFFEKMKFKRIDVETLGYIAINRHSAEIQAAFKTTDRVKLNKLIYSKPENYEKLMDIIWDTQRQLALGAALSCDNAIIEFTNLPASESLLEICDLKILVQAPTKVRQKRLVKENITAAFFNKKEKTNTIDYNQIEYDLIVGQDV